MYNMGFSLETTESIHVIVDMDVLMQFQIQPGWQEWITAIECICVDGTSIAPIINYKGEQSSQTWISMNVQVEE